MERIIKSAFSVIGREGSTKDGDGFIGRLWEYANNHFGEVAALAAKDENGQMLGVWGVMTDFSRTFQPWKDFREGLYLAGIECRTDAEAPDGWTRWDIPGYEYLSVEVDSPTVFSDTIAYLKKQGIQLAGAVHDFTDPATGRSYMYFPVRSL